VTIDLHSVSVIIVVVTVQPISGAPNVSVIGGTNDSDVVGGTNVSTGLIIVAVVSVLVRYVVVPSVKIVPSVVVVIGTSVCMNSVGFVSDDVIGVSSCIEVVSLMVVVISGADSLVTDLLQLLDGL